MDYIPKTSQEISYEDHVLMQSTAQAYISNAVSKTINMHNSATIDDVKRAYLLAMSSGCKGITVYRDGSLNEQVLETKEVPRREDVLEGKTKVHRDNERNTYVTVNFDEDGNLVEVFITGDGKTPEYIGRNISMHLRNGLSWEEVYSLHKKTGGYYEEICDTINDTINGDNIHSDENWVETNKGFRVNGNGETKCDVCDSINTVVMQDGCVSCSACMFYACSV